MKPLIPFLIISLTASSSCLALPASGLRSARAPKTLPTSVSVRSPRTVSPTITAKRHDSLLARVTVYWAKGGRGSDRWTRRYQTSTGTRLRTGHCAVDPRRIPYGSRVVLPTGETLAAVDTGTAVKNRKAARKSGRTSDERSALVVDRFFETKRQALAWAARNPLFMPVRVVRPTVRPATPPQMLIRKAQPMRPTIPVRVSQTSPIQTKLLASNQSTATSTRR